MERKRSKMPITGIPNGCMGGLFNFNQRLHIEKMLAYNKKGSDVKHIKRSKSPKAKQDVSTSEGHESVDTDANAANTPVEDKGSTSRNNSGKVHARGLNSKRRHSSSMSSIFSSSGQLLRTISIHHLESNDYTENAANNTENPPVVHDTDESGSSVNTDDTPLSPKISNGHALQSPSKPHGTLHTVDYVGKTKLNRVPDHLAEKHSLLREKLHNAKEAMSKKKGTDAKELEQDAAFPQSKEFMDMMLLLNNNRELLLKILKDPSPFISFLESRQSSSAERVLDRPGSFPVSGLSCGQNCEMSRLKHKPQRSELPACKKEDLHAGSSSEKPNANEDGVVGMASNAGGKISIPNSESGSTDRSRISSGFEPSDVIYSSCELKQQRENQWDNRAASARFKVVKKRIKDVIKDDRKGGHKISMDGILHKIPCGSKVFMDTEKEKQRLLDRPATTIYDRDNSRSRNIKRSHSLNESLDKYSRLLESILSRELRKTPERLKMKQKDGGGSKGAMPTKTLGRFFSLPDFDSDSLRKDVKHGVFGAVWSLKIPRTVDICDVEILDYSKGLSSQESIHDSFQEEEFINEEEETSDRLRKTSASDWLTKTSAVSNLELYFPENPITPAEVSAPETLEQCLLDIYVLDELDGSEAGSEGLEVPSEFDDYYNFFNVEVDPQNEIRFKFVRDILWKSGFGCNEFLRAWYSPNQPVDPLLFEETACTLNADREIYLESQPLFDLVNEVLLDIYDTSASCCPWLLRFDMRTRPMPKGHHVLEEVWANVSWHLNSQPQLDPSLDYDDVARDFEKNNGWMELQYDCEDAGLELEDLILDDLLDEIVLELESVSGLQYVYS